MSYTPDAQATIFIVNQRRFNARGLLDTVARCGNNLFGVLLTEV